MLYCHPDRFDDHSDCIVKDFIILICSMTLRYIILEFHIQATYAINKRHLHFCTLQLNVGLYYCGDAFIRPSQSSMILRFVKIAPS